MKGIVYIFFTAWVCSALAASGDPTIWDTIKFETVYPYISIDTAGSCIWQIAGPHKEFFSAPLSGAKVMVTDSVNPYPVTNFSFFEMKIGEFTHGWEYPYNICLELNHKFDTDTLCDGGYITISLDDGETWHNIFEQDYYFWDNVPGMEFYYFPDTLCNGERGFSGNSGDWISAKLEWLIYPVKSDQEYPGDTLLLRFNFISDGVDNAREGWMIDDIVLFSEDLGGGAVHALSSSDYYSLYPNPANDRVNIDFFSYYREIRVDIFQLNGQLAGSSVFENTDAIGININGLHEGLYQLRIRLDDTWQFHQLLQIE